MARSARKVSSERAFLRDVAEIDAPPAAVLWAVAKAVAHSAGVSLPVDMPLAVLAASVLTASVLTASVVAATAELPEVVVVPEVPADVNGCDVLGRTYEFLATPQARRERGVHFTPTSVANTLADLVLPAVQHSAAPVVTVCDPACGGGALLLGAARHMHRGGALPSIIVEHLYGCDLDPLAAAVAHCALTIWGRGRQPHIVSADGLAADPPWPTTDHPWPLAGFDVVIGNPPFLSQLGSATARSGAQRLALTAQFGNVAKGYSDTAALFLMRGMQLARAGGRVGMILPESIATTAAADNLRRWTSEHGTLESMWLPGKNLFDAQVRVCVPVVAIGGTQSGGTQSGGTVIVRSGVDAGTRSTVTLSRPENWSELVAFTQGIPIVTFPFISTNSPKLSDIAVCTADFRDQYYGLIPYVAESVVENPEPGFAPLVSVGLIDLGVQKWGEKFVKFGGGVFARPVVDVVRLTHGNPKLGAWASSRLVPKILVATQTKIVEAVVDERGEWLPSVPVLSVLPHDPAMIWRVMAVLAHPMISAWLAQQSMGSGLSATTMRIRASQLADIPLPADPTVWDGAADAARRRDWQALASIELFGPVNNAVTTWWTTHATG